MSLTDESLIDETLAKAGVLDNLKYYIMNNLEKGLGRFLLVAFLLSFAANSFAQLRTVSLGYGPFGFPPITNPSTGEVLAEATRGGAAYLHLAFTPSGGGDSVVGVQLLFGGDSQIRFGGKDYGSGFVGLLGTHDITWPSEKVRLGAAIGGIVIQNYERRDLLEGTGYSSPSYMHQPELKKTNFQPFGALRLSVYFVELQYAPVNGMVTVGFNLAFGR